jgi:isoquinoline 1-oxidoreductase alpha subunit
MVRYILHVNGQEHEVETLDDTPLLWVLRDRLKLTGTKYACGIGACGACIVHVDGEPVRSCMVPAHSVKHKAITTIEGLSSDLSHPVQQAWIDRQVPQCGYCQSGQIMAAAALLDDNPNPTDAEIDEAMAHVLCRCGTYQRVRDGIHLATKLIKEKA